MYYNFNRNISPGDNFENFEGFSQILKEQSGEKSTQVNLQTQ